MKRRGRPKAKEPTTHTAIRLPPDLLAWLREVAEREDRSVSYVVRRAVERDRERRE